MESFAFVMKVNWIKQLFQVILVFYMLSAPACMGSIICYVSGISLFMDNLCLSGLLAGVHAES